VRRLRDVPAPAHPECRSTNVDWPVEIGMEVEVLFSPISDGWLLPLFRPAARG
jgi:hypothetical protein